MILGLPLTPEVECAFFCPASISVFGPYENPCAKCSRREQQKLSAFVKHHRKQIDVPFPPEEGYGDAAGLAWGDEGFDEAWPTPRGE